MFLSTAVVLSSAAVGYAEYSAGHTNSYNSIDGGEIRWGGSTKYTLIPLMAQWNAVGSVDFLADDIWNIEDVTLMDKSEPAETWAGLYRYRPGIADEITFNTSYLDKSTTTSAQKQNVVLHELGHALGIDDHTGIWNIIMTEYVTGNNVLTTHDKADYAISIK